MAGPAVTNDQSIDLNPEGDDDGDLLAQFDEWGRRLDAHWSEWEQEAKLCFAFVAGEQWTDDDRAQMEEAQQIPVVFNLTAPTLDAVSGAEIQNRQQVQFYPREVGDSGVADVLTQAAEYINDETDGDQEDSDAFRDALICGVGWTEMRPEVDGADVTLVKERVDPLEINADPSSRKACFSEARFIRRKIPMSPDDFEEFKEDIGRPDAEADQGLGDVKRPTIVDPKRRYRNGMLGVESDDVIVCEWQWWEREPVHITALPQPDGTTKLEPLSPDLHEQAQQIAKEGGMGPLKSRQSTRKVYYRAFVGGGEILLKEELTVGSFTYKAMTGKRDRNKGVWYGLVRPMMDPQRFSNKLYSLIIDIVRKNAKGGLMLEEGAVSDIREFEATYASVGEITWLPNGTLASANGPRMQPKISPPIPQSLFQLMEWAKDMVRATTGVNEEILGLVNREQAGVLESQRKQAAYGILSPFFDAQRRYLRAQGRLMLAMMNQYLPEDKLVRIVDEGTKKYVTLAMLKETQDYDISVDEAPAGPNQKAKNTAVLTNLMPWLSEAQLDNEFWAKAAMYTDFTVSFAEELAAAFRRKAENEAQQGQAQAPVAQAAQAAELADKQASAMQKESAAKLNDAKTAQIIGDVLDPPPPPAPPMGQAPEKTP